MRGILARIAGLDEALAVSAAPAASLPTVPCFGPGAVVYRNYPTGCDTGPLPAGADPLGDVDDPGPAPGCPKTPRSGQADK